MAMHKADVDRKFVSILPSKHIYKIWQAGYLQAFGDMAGVSNKCCSKCRLSSKFAI